MKKNLFDTIENMKNLRKTLCLSLIAAILAGAAPVSTVSAEEVDTVISAEEPQNEEEGIISHAKKPEDVPDQENTLSPVETVKTEADAEPEESVKTEEPVVSEIAEESISGEDEEGISEDEEADSEDEDDKDVNGDEEEEEKLESDPEADLESPASWSRAILGITYGDDYRENLIRAAITQLGYTESVLNFEVFEEEERNKGYTRYGDWYGDEYGDWCAMFVAFCLRYSGNDIMTIDSNCEEWKNKLIAEGRYHRANEIFDEENPFELRPGDLIFFKLLEEERPFFSLKLVYDGKGALVEAFLDGKAISPL